MGDLLTDIKREIDRRLEELRPVMEEFRRLEQARDALVTSDGPRSRRRASGGNAAGLTRNSRPSRTRMTKAHSQEIDQRVLALLAEDSAQRPAALALLTESSVGSMNSRLNRLVREGKLKKRKRGNAVRFAVRLATTETAA